MYLKVGNEFHHFNYTEELQIFLAGNICSKIRCGRTFAPCADFINSIEDLLAYDDDYVEETYINENDIVIEHGQVAE